MAGGSTEWTCFGRKVGVEVKISLRRPGLSDLSPRVFRPPMVWTASPVSDVSLYGEFISVDRFDAWPSDIRWVGNHRYPLTTGCNRFEPNVFPPGHALVMRLAVRVPDDTLQEVQYHRKKATLAGQQERLLRPAQWAQASSRFQSSRGGMGSMAMSVANRLKTWGEDFFRNR